MMRLRFQIHSVFLDYVVLLIINQGDEYGYSLTQKIIELLDVSESSIYPVLRRLRQDNYLDIYDEPYQGRNRRYYTITDLGKRKLQSFNEEWTQFKHAIDILNINEKRNDKWHEHVFLKT